MAEKAAIDAFLAKIHSCSGTDPWAQDDREWFKNNPDRSHRVRPLYSEAEAEHFKRTAGCPPSGTRLVGVAVQQVEPGFRIRIQVCVDKNTTDAEANAIIDRINANEEEASALMMAAIQSKQGKHIKPEDIFSRMASGISS
jgi:hypothetical protein